MWSHTCFCLADPNMRSIPVKNVKDALNDAGLGEKRLNIQVPATASELHDALLDLYPPLARCCGYELLRSMCSGSSLVALEGPSSGHTPRSLMQAIGQSRIYVRPL